VLLRGLDPGKKYRFKEINLFPETRSFQPDNDKLLTGEYLMNIGINLSAGRVSSLTSNVYELSAE